jgi:hypothetical protein
VDPLGKRGGGHRHDILDGGDRRNAGRRLTWESPEVKVLRALDNLLAVDENRLAAYADPVSF